MKKGIIMAGGMGTRLHPVTKAINKHLLPVYDKPLIYYPISVMMLMGIKDILIIVNKDDINSFSKILDVSKDISVNIKFIIQKKPGGIPEGIKLGKNFIGKDKFAFMLGDNIFFGQNFTNILNKVFSFKSGCSIFTFKVQDPERYGILNKSASGKLIKIEEKPKKPKSNLAVTGFYIYDNKALQYVENLKKSNRGELEITDLNNIYIKKKLCSEVELGRTFTWLDAGTHDSYLEASNFVKLYQHRTGEEIACLEEIAFRKKFINSKQLKKIISKTKTLNKKKYLSKLLKK